MKGIDEVANQSPSENKQLLELLKQLKEDSSVHDQKEELRQKYENYKKMFLNAKAEKDQKVKEIQVLREEQPPTDLKELRSKYEGLKIMLQKEQNQRKDKEVKLEQLNAEMIKKNKSLDDLYSQIDQIYEASSSLQEKVDQLEKELNSIKTQYQQL